MSSLLCASRRVVHNLQVSSSTAVHERSITFRYSDRHARLQLLQEGEMQSGGRWVAWSGYWLATLVVTPTITWLGRRAPSRHRIGARAKIMSLLNKRHISKNSRGFQRSEFVAGIDFTVNSGSLMEETPGVFIQRIAVLNVVGAGAWLRNARSFSNRSGEQ